MANIIESKRALTYSLLAHINNSGNLAKGQLDIFMGVHFQALYSVLLIYYSINTTLS